MADAEFVNCAECGKAVHAGLPRCPFCTQELRAGPAPPPPSTPPQRPPEPDAGGPPPQDGAAAIGEAVAICPSCSREIAGTLSWCPFCGARLAEETRGTRRPDQPRAPLPPPPAFAAPAAEEPPEPVSPVAEEHTAGSRSVAVVMLGGLAILGAIAAVLVVVSFVRSGGEPEEAAGLDDLGDEVLTLFEPDPGDCARISRGGDFVEEDCDKPHDTEVFATPQYPAAQAFPGQEVISNYAAEICLEEFEPYFGTNYFISGVAVSSLSPTAESFADGDRGFICIASHPLGQKLDASLRDSQGIELAGYVPFALLTEGTCWDFGDLNSELVRTVPCGTPHDAETYAAFDYPAPAFPGEEEAQQFGEAECRSRHDDYAGADPDELIEYWAAPPFDESDWKNGYRVVICSLSRADGARMTGSARG